MIDQSDITMLISVAAAGLSAVGLLRSSSKDSTAAIDSVRRESSSSVEGLRKEMSPQFDGMRREVDTRIDGIRKESETKIEANRREAEGRLTACALENKDARHQWANDFGGKLSELANDLRRHKDAAETKLEAAERERRIMTMVTEVKSQTANVITTTNELRDMLTRVMVKLDVAPKQGSAD